MIKALLATLLAGQVWASSGSRDATPSIARFDVKWKEASDAPYRKLRVAIESYAFRKDVTYQAMRYRAVAAHRDWIKSPASPEALFRSYLWERVLEAAHYSSLGAEDDQRERKVSEALYRWKQIPPSAEFSRVVCMALSEEQLFPLANRVLTRFPNDPLLYYCMCDMLFVMGADNASISMVRTTSAATYAKHPTHPAARFLWISSPWIMSRTDTLADSLVNMKVARTRTMQLLEGPLGAREKKFMSSRLERLNRFIKASELLVKSGRGGENAYTFRG